jgi:predicted ArsR family transcriptional regulator
MELPFLRGTKGRILRLLRRGALTADEIAAPLDVTANGARFHLTELERDGLVEQRSVRRGPRKPSHSYSLTASGDSLFPKAYDALSKAVLQDVRETHGSGEVLALCRRLGRRLAGENRALFAEKEPEDTTGRAAVALSVLEEMGGVASLTTGDDAAVISGLSCPFKAVVPDHPEVCAVLEEFLAGALQGASVRETCEKDGLPHCRFEISAPREGESRLA